MKTLLTLITLLTITFYAHAQTGTLTGKVKDKTTNEPIIGATVAVSGTTQGATTDFEGNFSISLDPGTYKITATYVSYKPQTFDNVQVTSGKTTSLNVSMEEAATALQAVTVTGARQTNTDIALIQEIKSSNIVVSGMSSEQIMRTQDRDAAEVVKRIPGITIMDNRFIVVRGLSERYNTVMLNEALAPSSEVDVRAFSFDVLPTSVIDRVLIFKSPAPELPGDFAGGTIKVYTKNVVNENATSFSISSSHRGGTTFKDFNTYTGSKTDFLGFDDGTRKLPSDFPSTATFQNSLSASQKAQYGKTLPNIWKINNAIAAPDLRMSLGLNRLFSIGDRKLTSITAATYTNARQNLNIERNNYFDYTEGQPKEINMQFRDQLSSSVVRVGLLQNFALSLNEQNKIEFRNLFNQIGLTQATIREGFQRDLGDQEERNYFLGYESRSILSSQLQGTHTLANKKDVITWNGGFNFINRDQPDIRRLRTVRPTGSEAPYDVIIPSASSLNNAGRFYSDLTERGIIAGGQLEHTFGNPDSAATEKSFKLKVGFYSERKDRDFNSRYFGYIFPFGSTANRQSITRLPLEQVFAPQNLDASNGMIIDELTRINDRYTASNTLGAGYVSLTKTLNKITFYGGVRGEYNLRKLTAEDYTSDVNVNDGQFYLLPSANLAYNFNNRSLLRFAYGKTLNRPEFREQARFSFYDFNENASISGNPDLVTATIHNLDLRHEFYPTPTELISLGIFYKKFFNPIETTIVSSGGAPTYSFANAEEATDFGLEAEIKKSLITTSNSRFIQNHSFILNASVIRSRVNFGDSRFVAAQDNERALQGQSPYIINTGLYFQDDDNGWQYSIMYNVLGKRIYRVGSVDGNPTVYEMPRSVIDLSLTKNFKNGLQFKAGVQDILNQASNFIQDTDRNGKITSFDDSIIYSKRGTYSTVGLSYNF